MIQTIHCVDVLSGGVASVLFSYAQACRNVSFNYISIAPADKRIHRQVELCGGRIIADGVQSWAALATAINHAKELTGADIFHVHRNWHNLLPSVQAKRAGYQVVISHAHNVFPASSWVKKVYHSIFQLSIKRCADACWGCSPEAIRFLYGKHPKNPLFIPNPISFQRYHFSEVDRVEKRRALNLSDAFVIVHSGIAIPQKNHLFLFQVFAAVKEVLPEAKLLLLGPDRRKDYWLVELADRLGICEDVLFCGYVDDAEKYYSAGDLFLFPSLNEGFPVALCEAQASGLSFLASDTITRKTNLFGNGKYLPINQGVDSWVAEIMKADRVRHIPDAETINMSHYNINNSAWRLEQTYAYMLEGAAMPEIAALWDGVL